MLLTLTYTGTPATDLGHLLHKHPGRSHVFELPFGAAHVFYPEASPTRCTAALLLEVDPIALARGRRPRAGGAGQPLSLYVNDRPYVCSSFFSVALRTAFGTAFSARSKERPELASRVLLLEARLSVIPCHDGEGLLRRLFEPLGYRVNVQPHLLDPHQPAWGDSPYYTLSLEGSVRLSELLRHLYVLLPVIDGEKHYWVGEDELEKLLRHGEGWLDDHPERALISRRYLKYQPGLATRAVAQLTASDRDPPPSAAGESLREQRLQAVIAELDRAKARRVLDLGCGDGQLLQALLARPELTEVVGVDVSPSALERARRRLQLDKLPERKRGRVQLRAGSLLYRDRQLEGYDAAVLAEVVEHIDLPRLAAFEQVVFGYAKPRLVLLTTPNAEYNVLYERLPGARPRHPDHRFEWSRPELLAWGTRVAASFGYRVRFEPVGPVHPEFGAPSQLAVFER